MGAWLDAVAAALVFPAVLLPLLLTAAATFKTDKHFAQDQEAQAKQALQCGGVQLTDTCVPCPSPSLQNNAGRCATSLQAWA
jgi:hypothetical protein